MAADFIGGSDLGDLNGDGLANTRLDAMIAGLEELTRGLIELGPGRHDRDRPDPVLDRRDACRDADARAPTRDGDGILDLIEHVRALELGGGTDYGRAFEVAVEFFEGQPPATNLLYFLSDGRGIGDFEGDLALLTDPAGARRHDRRHRHRRQCQPRPARADRQRRRAGAGRHPGGS